MEKKIRIILTKAKKAYSTTKIPGAKWAVNPYIGCEHACKYCYAKFMCKYYNYGEWGSWVVVKENLPPLIKNKYVNGRVVMSTVSDVYQPVEREFLLTRNVLKNMSKSVKLSILTKSDLVLRDIDLFKKFACIEVGLTINGFEGELKKEIEPYSPCNKKRIEALKILNENGIKNYAFISPIIPGLVDVKKLIKETKNFTTFYWFEFLNLNASGREFRKWLMENHPESYEILSDKTKTEKYINSVIDVIEKSRVTVKGICIHHPKLVIRKNIRDLFSW